MTPSQITSVRRGGCASGGAEKATAGSESRTLRAFWSSEGDRVSHELYRRGVEIRRRVWTGFWERWTGPFWHAFARP
jgi:hypothetical protein